MKGLFISFTLLIALSSPVSAERAFDLDEYGSIKELSTAFSAQFFGGKGHGAESRAGKKIKLALLPIKPVRPDIVAGFSRALTESGKFELLEIKKSAAFVKEKQLAGDALVKEMKAAFNLDAVATIRSYSADGKVLVVSRMFSDDQVKTADLFAALLDPRDDARSVAAATIGSAGASLPDLPFPIRLFAVADLEGDGALEYVFSDGERMHVYRLDTTGWRAVWAEPKESAGLTKQLYLETADINANGKPEIFVTVLKKGKVSSAVFEEEKGAYKQIAVIPDFVRVLMYSGRGPMLLVQNYDENRFFGGTPKQYVWSGTGYVAGPEFPLPENVLLYGFGIADFGEAHPALVANDWKNRLSVYSRENLIWESQERYGAREVVAVESGKDAYNVQLEKTIKGRFFTYDVDGDGRDDVISPRNTGGSPFTDPKEGEIVVMDWNGARLEQKFKFKVPGPVLDIQLVRRDSTAQVFVLVQTKGGLFSKPGSRLLSYSLQ